MKPHTGEIRGFSGIIRTEAGRQPATVCLRLAVAGVALSLLAACANPYVDSRREAGQKQLVGASTPDMVAICFSPSKTPRDQVTALAQPECAKTGRMAAFDHEDPWSCTLLAPNRAFYRCSAKP
ncbi:MAG: hypothetical protein K1X51_01410 [Rhodospirillaceae bacterium]|nr:hypothetical protein [Rhodospirillaceae bacterium]